MQDFFWKWPFYTANMIFENFEIFYHPNGLRLCRRHRFQVFSSLYHILGGSTTVFLGQNQCFCLFEAPKIHVLKPFWTSRPTFFTNKQPNEPPVATSNVMGPFHYLYGVLGVSNMQIVILFQNPIYQSRSKMGPICQNHNFMCTIDIFRFQQPKFY